MRHENMLDPKRAALAVIDVQESFRPHIPDFAEVAARVALVTQAAQMLGIPVVVTEQYPKGLGHTAGEIRAVLPEGFEAVEKTAFSSCGAREFVARLERAGAHQIMLCGIEAHVCVNQTAHDLIALGFQVHLLTDCISSRAEQNKRIGVEKMLRSGALPSSIELALFELMRDARHEQFKAIQKLIK
ncbi:MAG TPA: isochorismatase family protein [Pyrinomonadaceae bacterium]|nr:isochorismatase family protein [Pyrinomonadaceae bacterium]